MTVAQVLKWSQVLTNKKETTIVSDFSLYSDVVQAALSNNYACEFKNQIFHIYSINDKKRYNFILLRLPHTTKAGFQVGRR